MRKLLACALLLLSGCCPADNEPSSLCEAKSGRLIRNGSGQILCVSPEGKIINL